MQETLKKLKYTIYIQNNYMYLKNTCNAEDYKQKMESFRLSMYLEL